MIILKRLLPYLSFPLNNQLNGRLIRYFLNHVFDDLTKTVGVHKRHSDGRANNKCHFRFLPVDYPVRLSSGPCVGNDRELKQRRGRWQREQQKEQSVLINKTTTLHVHHVFLYISLPSLHDYYVKLPNFTFYGGREQRTTISFFFCELRYSLLEFNSLKIANKLKELEKGR